MAVTTTVEELRESKDQACPNCAALMAVDPGFVTWCDQCGWNLRPHIAEKPKNIFERLYLRLGKESSKRLFDKLVKASSLRAQFTGSRAIIFLIAALAHGLTLLFAFLALDLIVNSNFEILPLLGGAFFGLVAWNLRPRFPKLGEDALVADPATFPTLYRVAAEVAAALNTSPPATIVINEEFNAGFLLVGWRRRKTIALGLPLVTVLNAQELVALLSHELAHGVNGDQNRTLFVGSAIRSLTTWYEILHPGRIWEVQQAGSFGLIIIPATIVAHIMMTLLANIAFVVLYLLSHLMFHDMQRAEYLADSLSARVAGTTAELGTLDKLHLSYTFNLVLQHISLADSKRNLFSATRQATSVVPEREKERIRRVEHMSGSRLDVTHPPTVLRLEMLRARPVSEPQVVLASADFERINQELTTVERQIQAELIDQHRSRISY